jgi:hypothetical protein
MIDPQLHEDTPAVTGRTLRQFAALSLVIFGGLAAWQGLAKQRLVAAAVLAGVALLVGAVGLARPERIRPVFSVLIAITTPIGRVVSLVLLGAMFYGVFTPLGLIFRLFGRDVLHVGRQQRESYWVEKPVTTDPRSYLRQS